MKDAYHPFSHVLTLTIGLIAGAIILSTGGGGAAYADKPSHALSQTQLEAQANAQVWESPDGLVGIYGKASGSVTYNVETKTLMLDGVKAETVGFRKDGSLTLKLTGSNSVNILDEFECEYMEDDSGYYCTYDEKGSVTLEGAGSITGRISLKGKLVVNGGTITSDEAVSCGSLTMTKGGINAPVSCSKGIVLNGGKIAISKYRDGTAVNCRNLLVNGGKITLRKCDGTGINCSALRMSKGSIIVDDQYDGTAVCVDGGNLLMTGGTLKVTRSFEDAICVTARQTGGETYRGKTTPVKTAAGKMTVKGGAVSASVRTPSDFNAVSARLFSCNAKRMKAVKGQMPAGFIFKFDGNLYKVTEPNYSLASDSAQASSMTDVGGGSSYPGDYTNATMLKYGSKKAAATIATVKFGGHRYSVNGIGASAFSTKQGAKVKSAVFKNTLITVGANAFSGTKSLSALKVDLHVKLKCKGFLLKSASMGKSSIVSKTAFSKCGKSSGAKLTVSLNASPDEGEPTMPRIVTRDLELSKRISESYASAFKALLMKHGLPKKTSVRDWER